MGGLVAKNGKKSTFFDITFKRYITLDFYETWPKVAKYGLLLLGIGLYALKILVFELIPLILCKQ